MCDGTLPCWHFQWTSSCAQRSCGAIPHLGVLRVTEACFPLAGPSWWVGNPHMKVGHSPLPAGTWQPSVTEVEVSQTETALNNCRVFSCCSFLRRRKLPSWSSWPPHRPSKDLCSAEPQKRPASDAHLKGHTFDTTPGTACIPVKGEILMEDRSSSPCSQLVVGDRPCCCQLREY